MDTRGNPSNLWISLRGIPVEYKLDAFNMPRTGTTWSPQNWLCRSERNPALDTLAPISPWVHINGDNAYSPPDTRHETHSDIQSSIPTTATCFSPIQSLTRPTTHAATSTFSTSHNSISSPCLNSTSLAAPKANQIFHAANKKLSLLCC